MKTWIAQMYSIPMYWIPTLSILAFLMMAAPTMAEPLVYEGSEGIGKGKHIVFIANDHEYRSEQSCPLMAKILAKHHGFKCTVLFGVDDDGNIKGGAREVPGLESLKDADLLVFFTRFMNMPDNQAAMLVDYFERGGPAVGIRTSTHCFNGQKGTWAKLNYNYSGEDYAGGLGKQVFGNTWEKKKGQSHYGQNHQMGCRITPVESAKSHVIMTGVTQFHAYSGAYKSQPPADATPLLDVQVLKTLGPSDDVATDKPLVNAGWTRDSYVAPSGDKKDARIVYVSFGASEDLLDEGTRRFLLNASLWAGGWDQHIKESLDVSIVGKYAPSPFTTGAYFYSGVKPSDLAGWDSQIMPESAMLAGLDDPKSARKHMRALTNRPELKAMLAEKYPDIYGSEAKLPEAPKNQKQKKKQKEAAK